MLGDVSPAPAGCEELLCPCRDLRRQHRGTARRARRVERRHVPRAILGDAPDDAALGDAEGPHDIHLAAGALADQLGGKHSEGAGVTPGMMEHRLGAAEIGPSVILSRDADPIAEAGSPVGEERQ